MNKEDAARRRQIGQGHAEQSVLVIAVDEEGSDADAQIRQQSMPPHMNPSTFAVAWDILKTGGLRGLYRGYTATLIRESAYGPYFCS